MISRKPHKRKRFHNDWFEDWFEDDWSGAAFWCCKKEKDHCKKKKEDPCKKKKDKKKKDKKKQKEERQKEERQKEASSFMPPLLPSLVIVHTSPFYK
ncbi:hypothetical protein [Bacillus amyloliquefaciens]|uniref:hypothetical protein n=1 Tax=Bacillus amyloliquefaciens TaxID=1390 RepID=UPI003F7157A1